jgi:ubiquinone/menaquinone biosynthesis C-methylase UbiE
MSDSAGNDATGIDVKSFEAIDASKELQAYINILDVFDRLPGIQTLKKAAIERCHIREGMSILDAGCGTGLETMRLARLVGSSGSVIGLDASRNLLAEASRRAQGSRLPIEYREGDVQQLPFPDNYFDVARAERLFLYLTDPRQALADLVRVTKSDGIVYVIEPDFETQTINLSDRGLVRKVLQFDCDHETRNGWIGRELPKLFKACGLVDIDVETSVVIYDPRSFSPYFLETARSAFQNGVITTDELKAWQGEIHSLLDHAELFCTISYFAVVGHLHK